MHAGIWKKSRFSTNISLFLGNDTRRATVTMERQQELVCDQSNGAISNDLTWPWVEWVSEIFSDTTVGTKISMIYINDIYPGIIIVSRYFQAKNSWYFFIFSKYQPLLFTYFSIHAYLTQTAQVPLNDAKILPTILTLWVGCNNATYDRHRRTAHGIRRT